MRLLHVVPYYLPATVYGGLVGAAHGLCRELAALGHSVTVFTTTDAQDRTVSGRHAEAMEIDGVWVRYFRRSIISRVFHATDMGAALNHEVQNYDLVHVHGIYTWPGYAASRSARQFHVPYFLSPHGMLMRQAIQSKNSLVKSAWIRFIECRTLQHAAMLHFTSDLEKNEYEMLSLPKVPSIRIPNGVELSRESSQTQEASVPSAIFLGRLNQIKGLDRLIMAWAQVPNLTLVIAGNDEGGYAAELKMLATRSGVADRIRWVGFADEAMKHRLLQEASLLILPSYSENFGMVVIEAWAAARPVVVTPEVGLASTVSACGGGLVSSGDPANLAATIKTLVNDSSLRAKCGAAGREIIAREFSWPIVATRMEAEYLRVVSKKGA